MSIGFKSGDRGSHPTCPPYPQILLPNIVDKRVHGCRDLFTGAPSCWNNILDNLVSEQNYPGNQIPKRHRAIRRLKVVNTR